MAQLTHVVIPFDSTGMVAGPHIEVPMELSFSQAAKPAFDVNPNYAFAKVVVYLKTPDGDYVEPHMAVRIMSRATLYAELEGM